MVLATWFGGSWQATLQAVGLMFLLYTAVIWVATAFWVWRDIRQRTRDPLMQTVSVLLVVCFFVPGLFLYLIARPRHTVSQLYSRSLEQEALLQELEHATACPECHRRVQDEFLVCPTCTTELKTPCTQCSKPLAPAWSACPYCTLEREPTPQRLRPAPQRTRVPQRVARPQPQRVPVAAATVAKPERREPTPSPFVPPTKPASPPIIGEPPSFDQPAGVPQGGLLVPTGTDGGA